MHSSKRLTTAVNPQMGNELQSMGPLCRVEEATSPLPVSANDLAEFLASLKTAADQPGTTAVTEAVNISATPET